MAQGNEIGLSIIGGNQTSEASEMLSAQCESSDASSIKCFSPMANFLKYRVTVYRIEGMQQVIK